MDVSAVLILADEGARALGALLSARRAVEACRAAGFRAELLLLLDGADDATRRDAAELRLHCDGVTELPARDRGAACNLAAEVARGRFLALLDGDTAWSANWLTAALGAAQAREAEAVWHPEAVLCLRGTAASWLRHTDMGVLDTDRDTLALRDHWTSSALAPRGLHLRVPHAARDAAGLFGQPGWGWNMDVVAGGATHEVVTGTAHILRLAPGAAARAGLGQGPLAAPSPLARLRWPQPAEGVVPRPA